MREALGRLLLAFCGGVLAGMWATALAGLAAPLLACCFGALVVYVWVEAAVLVRRWRNGA